MAEQTDEITATEVLVETDEERLLRILNKFPINNSYNTIPIGESKITFMGEPEDNLGSYDYNEGNNKGKRYHVKIMAIIPLSENSTNKVIGVKHPLGLSKSAYISLLAYLDNGKKSFLLNGRSFSCTNKKNRSYCWKELVKDENE